MHSLKEIYSLDRKTYRSQRGGHLLPVWKRYLSVATISVFLAFAWTGLDAQAIVAIITVLSVLVGFSFSVLFFLVSSDQGRAFKDGMLEKELQLARVEQLSQEIFINVTFFIILAIFIIMAGVINFFPAGDFFLSLSGYSQSLDARSESVETFKLTAEKTFEFFGIFLSLVLRAAFWVGVLLSSLAFLRIVKRVSFLFSEILDLRKSDRAA